MGLHNFLIKRQRSKILLYKPILIHVWKPQQGTETTWTWHSVLWAGDKGGMSIARTQWSRRAFPNKIILFGNDFLIKARSGKPQR